MKDEKLRHYLFNGPLDSFTPEREKYLRTPTLKLEVETMAVHHIESIRVETKPYQVRRHPMNKSTDDF